MENKNCDMCTMPNCISRNLSSKEDCLLDKKLSVNDSFDFLEQLLAKFAIDFAYKGKTLKECLDKYKANIIAAAHTIEPTIHGIVDEHYWKMLGKNPVSEDMWEASKQYALRQVLASTDAVMTEQAYLSLKLFSGFEIAVAHKDGANWQKEQFEKKAFPVEIGRQRSDYKCMLHGNFLHYDTGDKVKVIIIKKE